MRTILTALLFLCLGIHVAAAYSLFGDGLESCGTWITDREANTDATDEQYILGFVSGLGDMDATATTVNTDSNGIYGWIDNYCLSHPTVTLGYAAGEFWIDSGAVVAH